jgi:hypothetical protein
MSRSISAEVHLRTFSLKQFSNDLIVRHQETHTPHNELKTRQCKRHQDLFQNTELTIEVWQKENRHHHNPAREHVIVKAFLHGAKNKRQDQSDCQQRKYDNRKRTCFHSLGLCLRITEIRV